MPATNLPSARHLPAASVFKYNNGSSASGYKSCDGNDAVSDQGFFGQHLPESRQTQVIAVLDDKPVTKQRVEHTIGSLWRLNKSHHVPSFANRHGSGA